MKRKTVSTISYHVLTQWQRDTSPTKASWRVTQSLRKRPWGPAIGDTHHWIRPCAMSPTRPWQLTCLSRTTGRLSAPRPPARSTLGNLDDGGGHLSFGRQCGLSGHNTAVTLTYACTRVAAALPHLLARAESGNALVKLNEFNNDHWLDQELADPGSVLPLVSCRPKPVEGASSVPVATHISWTCGDPNPDNAVTYNVYLSTRRHCGSPSRRGLAIRQLVWTCHLA